MAGRILLRAQAREDLIVAHQYIFERAPLHADGYMDRLERRLELLAGQPTMGAARLVRHPELRVFPMERHIAVYRPLPDGIEVIRVFHSSRNWMALLDES